MAIRLVTLIPCGALLAALAIPAAPVCAHPLAPALLELVEETGGVVSVRWRTAAVQPAGTRVEPLLPSACRPLSEPRARLDGTAVESTWRVHCPKAASESVLVGRRIGVTDLDRARIEVLLRVVLADGRSQSWVLGERDETVTVPARQPPLAVAAAYAQLGLGHIAFGFDHLAFVFGLLLLVGRRPRRLVATITGFTAGHSVTLAVAALGLVTPPARAVELAVALSVFALAVALARGPEARPGLMRRHPVVLSACFGLLHGLAFAEALREAGLPSGDVPLALLSFNVGIELGQLAFVGLVVCAAALGTRAARPLSVPAGLRAVPVYALGVLSAYWCFERAASLLG